MKWRCYTLAVVAVVFSGCFQTVHSFVQNMTEAIPGTDEVCDTAACISAADSMMNKMNLSADPCEDFNEFACGRFIDEYVLPEGETDISAFDILTNNIMFLLHDVIVNNTDPTRPQYVKNIQRFFNSCMNETQIEVVGLAPYFNDREFADDWPTLNPNWSEADFDLNEVIARYAKVSVSPLFDVSVTYDHDVSRYVIELKLPLLEIDKGDLLGPRNNSHVQAYERLLVETAVSLNASREVAERDARDVVDLRIALTRIMDETSGYTNELNQFSSLYPNLDIAVRSYFSTVNITLADDETVFNQIPSYITAIESVLENFPNRTIQNLFAFQHCVLQIYNLTWRTRQFFMDFIRSIHGAMTEPPRWLYCVNMTARKLDYGISKMLAQRSFSETAKSKVNTMIDELQEELRKMIEEATWMSNVTKSEDLEKLAALKRKVGYPDTGFTEADLERRYENYIMSEDNFYNNRLLIDELSRMDNLALLRKPEDNTTWASSSHKVRIYNSLTRNEIEILAGLMQPPFYSESFPDYLNYGGIGYTIGREITHLFDYTGRQFDQNGDRRDWWATEEDRENFVNRTRCFVNQYSNFYINEINMNLNGGRNEYHSVSDTSGLKQSFRAYKQHVLNHGQQPRLPDLNLSQDQLFFLSFAQLYCQKITRESLIREVQHRRRPPGKYRIIGTLQNSEDFARVYNCTQGSYMNPERKCTIW